MKIQWKYLVIPLVMGWFLGAASILFVRHLYPRHENHFERMRARFSKELKLTPEQKTKVDEILQTNRQKLDQIFSEVRPKVEEVRNSTRAQIRALLNAEQRTAFDKLDAKMKARFEKRFSRMYEKWHGEEKEK